MIIDNSAPFCAKLIFEHPDCMLRILFIIKRDNTIDSYCLCKILYSVLTFSPIMVASQFFELVIDVSKMGNTDFPPLIVEGYDIFESFANNLTIDLNKLL